MMRLRQWLAVFLAAVMVTTTTAWAAPAQEEYATRGEAVEMLLTAADDYRPDAPKSDIIKGYGDGQLHEEQPVTRAEALIMLTRAFGGFPELKGNNLRRALPREDFTDIPEWAEAELAPALEAGIVAGTAPGKFSPDEPVTEQQLELWIDRVFTLYSTNLKDSFYSTVNKDGLETLTIQDGQSSAGTIDDVINLVDEQIAEVIADAVNSDTEPGSPQEKIKIL